MSKMNHARANTRDRMTKQGTSLAVPEENEPLPIIGEGTLNARDYRDHKGKKIYSGKVKIFDKSYVMRVDQRVNSETKETFLKVTIQQLPSGKPRPRGQLNLDERFLNAIEKEER